MSNEQSVLSAIAARVEAMPGHVGFYYKNLATGLEFGVRQEEAYLAASVIKLPLFLHILQQSAAGEFALDQKLTVENREKMPSCGALNSFTGPVEADIETLCRLMITISDNTATNKLINFCTIDGANAGFRGMGLKKTVLRRLLFDAEASARGLENTVSPREMGMLLERLYRREFVSPQVSEFALEVLLKQQIGHKLDGKLCGQVPIAHKTGEDDCLSNDVGLILAEQPFVLCFTGHDTDVYPWEDLIRNAACDLVQAQK